MSCWNDFSIQRKTVNALNCPQCVICTSESYNAEKVRSRVRIRAQFPFGLSLSECQVEEFQNIFLFYLILVAAPVLSLCSSLRSRRVLRHHMWEVIVIVAMCVMVNIPTMKTLMNVCPWWPRWPLVSIGSWGLFGHVFVFLWYFYLSIQSVLEFFTVSLFLSR